MIRLTRFIRPAVTSREIESNETNEVRSSEKDASDIKKAAKRTLAIPTVHVEEILTSNVKVYKAQGTERGTKRMFK